MGGSFSVDILRTYVDQRKGLNRIQNGWYGDNESEDMEVMIGDSE